MGHQKLGRAQSQRTVLSLLPRRECRKKFFVLRILLRRTILMGRVLHAPKSFVSVSSSEVAEDAAAAWPSSFLFTLIMIFLPLESVRRE